MLKIKSRDCNHQRHWHGRPTLVVRVDEARKSVVLIALFVLSDLGISLDGSQLSAVALDELCLRRAILSYRFWIQIGPELL